MTNEANLEEERFITIRDNIQRRKMAEGREVNAQLLDECLFEAEDIIRNEKAMKNLTRREINLLVALVEAQKQTIGFLRGFGKQTKEEQDQEGYYNRLIEKLKS